MTSFDTRTLQFGSAVIEYTLRRSTRRRKTVEIMVDPVDGVLVAAPASATDPYIDNIVRRRAPWILRRLGGGAYGAGPVANLEFVTGETILYLGRQYRLRITSDNDLTFPLARLTGGWLEVSVPKGRRSTDGRQTIVRALVHWYKQHAERKLKERVAHYGPRLGVEPTAVLVRSQERRWGSCAPDGALRFNWRIIMAPISIVDYVVVHELCHLRYAHHGREFWQRVANVVPDYQVRRQSLKRNGPTYRLS